MERAVFNALCDFAILVGLVAVVIGITGWICVKVFSSKIDYDIDYPKPQPPTIAPKDFRRFMGM